MTRKLWLCGLVMGVAGLVRAQEAVLTADTFVSTSNGNENFGASPNMRVGNGNLGLLRFDVTQTVPAGVTATNLQKATLVVYVNRVIIPGNLSAHLVLSPWDEMAVTLNSAPTAGPSLTTATVGTSQNFVAIDVTPLVQEWLGFPPNDFGLELQSTGEVVLDTKESSATSHPARIIMEFASVGPQGDIGPQGPQGAQGSPGLSGVQQVLATGTVPNAFTYATVTASCPAPKVVVGGGCDALFGNNGGAYVAPTIVKATPIPNGYVCEFTGGDTINMPVAATAICANAQ